MKKLTTFLSSSSSRSSRTRKMATGSGTGESGSGGSKPKKLHGIVNDLRFQKSPYLLQHKNNPVEW